MVRSRTARGLAEEGGGARGVHPGRFPAKQRLHLAALLILLATLPLRAQSDIGFDPAITQEEFSTFSRLLAQGIYASPVEPAHARGLLGFDIGLAVTAVPVDTDASWWQRAVQDDFTAGGHLGVPRVVAAKGLGFGTLSASLAKVPDSDLQVWGAALDVPVIDGGVVKPTLALRGAWSTLSGVDELDLTTYGVELFLSKGFGPVTPYGALGLARSDAEGRVPDGPTLTDQSEAGRVTLGVKFSFFIPKIVVEATQGEERSYAAKVSIGL